MRKTRYKGIFCVLLLSHLAGLGNAFRVLLKYIVDGGCLQLLNFVAKSDGDFTIARLLGFDPA